MEPSHYLREPNIAHKEAVYQEAFDTIVRTSVDGYVAEEVMVASKFIFG